MDEQFQVRAANGFFFLKAPNIKYIKNENMNGGIVLSKRYIL